MTKLEITDKKTSLLDANEAMFTTASAEKRGLNDIEKQSLSENLTQLEDLELQERTLGFKNFSGKIVPKVEVRKVTPKFSLIKAINAKLENKPFDEETRDMFILGKNEMRKAGVEITGDIILPMETRSDILAGTTSHGEEIVSEDKKSILPPLVDKLIFSQAGATYLTGLVGDVSIPNYAGTTVLWKTEVETAVDGAGTFAEVIFAPKRLTAFIDVSRQFLAQDGVGAEALLLDNIQSAVARKLESTILGIEALSATQPEGIFWSLSSGVTNTAVVVPTNLSIIAMETSVEAANVEGSMAYITSSTGRGILKGIDKSTSSGEFLCENGMVNGYPLLVTNAVSDAADEAGTGSGIVFGNWKDLVIASWGGTQITVDPYTLAATGQVRIVVNGFFDAKGIRGASGSGGTLNSYATSFKPAAIKAS